MPRGTAALLSTGVVDCWGDNRYGELGTGTTGGPDGENGYDTPQAVSGISNAVFMTHDGWNFGGYCAVLSTGSVDCWGDNTGGEIGNGTIGGPDDCPSGDGAIQALCYDTLRWSPASPTQSP